MSGTLVDFDLTAIMREVWDDTRETNPRVAAREILRRVPEDSDEQLLLYLLDRAYSTFISPLWREPPIDQEPSPRSPQAASGKPPRRRPAINPDAYHDGVMRDLDERPFFVPSQGTRMRVRFKDMTAEFWHEWVNARRTRAAGYEASAQWGEMNISRLAQHGVERSGDLPDVVKKEIFAGEPMMPGE